MFSPVFEISFTVTLILLIILRPISFRFNLVDYPNNRKIHKGQIPLIGGISIFIGFFTAQIFINASDILSILIIFTSVLILLVGLCDDLINLRPRTKLFFQILILLIMIVFSDLKISSLGPLFFGEDIPILPFLSIPITIIAVIGLINAFNMIDGLDGIASGLAMISILGMLYHNINAAHSIFTNMLLAILFALIPFFFFNVTSISRIKVFLGDGGSLLLGYIIAWGLIYSAESIKSFSPIFSLWCVVVPLYDFFAVITIRILEKRPLFLADKDHLHHFLLNFNLSRRFIMILIITFAFLMLLMGIYLEKNMPHLSFQIFLAFFILFLFLRVFFRVGKMND